MTAASLSPRCLRLSWLAASAALFWHGAALCQSAGLHLHTATYDPPRQRMIVFGGLAGAPLNEAWQLTLSGTPRWLQLTAAGPPPSSRFGHSAIYDPLRDRIIVFGGNTDAGEVNDVWALSLSDPPAWSELQPSGASGFPEARFYHSAIYDPSGDRMVVYGGSNSFGLPMGDAWSLQLSPSLRWEPLAPTGTLFPASRFAHSAIYDPVRDRMLVFGGGPSLSDEDIWALSLGSQLTWSRLQRSVDGPPPLIGHSAIYDPGRDRMIVFGGSNLSLFFNDVWELSLAGTAAWKLLLDTGPPDGPSDRAYHSTVYDSAYDRAVVFGGTPGVTEPTWAFSLEPPLHWSPLRPAIRVLPSELRIPPVTVGDSAWVPFVIANVGLEPLQVTDFQLPASGLRVGSPAPLDLAWNEAIPETLFLDASQALDSLVHVVIRSTDPLVSDTQVPLRLTVLGLEFDTRVLGPQPEAELGAALVVVATPKPGVHIERSILHYRVADGRPDFESVPFTALATDFIAAIPGAAVTEHGVQYYVTVENSGFVATQPPAAPDTVFTQAVAAPTSVTAVPTSSSDFLAGHSIVVEVLLPPGASFVSGVIRYRQGGMPNYQSATLSMNTDLGRPTGIIHDSVVGTHGIEYWLEVTTLKSTLAFGDSAAPQIIPTKVQNLAEPSSHAGSRYRLLTVPLDFRGDYSLDALLTDQLGTYDPVGWRAYTYDVVSGENIELSTGPPARFVAKPGRAFWLISREAHRVDTWPIPGYSTPTGDEYPIPLAEGWNLFGNPFDFPVAWSDVRRDTAVVGVPVAFNPSLGRIGDYADGSPFVLLPFEGYFIHASQPESLWVTPRAAILAVEGAPSAGSDPASTPSPVAHDASASSWRLRVRASTDEAVDGSNVLGLASEAADGFDSADWLKPPPAPGPWVQVAFAHPEWQERSGRYRRDLRNPGSEGHTWEIEIRSGTSADAVTLDFSEIVPVPSGLAVRLIDREQGSSADWARAGSSEEPGIRHRIVSFGSRPYRLAIVAGTHDYVSRASQQALAVPLRVTLDQNAPNPFRSATRIRFGLPRAEQVTLEVYSVLGQRVAVPLDREQLEPGYHAVVWDGQMAGGGLAPSGVYLLRLVAAGEALTRRVILVR